MVLVHELTSRDGDHINTALTVETTNPFVEDGRLLEGGLIEHVAQSVALGMGHEALGDVVGTSPPVGFIGAISRLSIQRLPAVGERLETQVQVTYRMAQVQVVHGQVRCGEEPVAEMEMKVFIMDRPGDGN